MVPSTQQCVCIYTAVYSQTLTAISIFKYANIVCIIQVHSAHRTINSVSICTQNQKRLLASRLCQNVIEPSSYCRDEHGEAPRDSRTVDSDCRQPRRSSGGARDALFQSSSAMLHVLGLHLQTPTSIFCMGRRHAGGWRWRASACVCRAGVKCVGTQKRVGGWSAGL